MPKRTSYAPLVRLIVRRAGERTPRRSVRRYADSVGVGALTGAVAFGVRFVRFFCAFAYASGFRFLKYASVSLACFAESTQVEPFAEAGRAYVLRRYARTILPLIPSVAASSSGRNVLAFAMLVTSFPVRAFAVRDSRARVESPYSASRSMAPVRSALARTRRSRASAGFGAAFTGTEYRTQRTQRTIQRYSRTLDQRLGVRTFVRTLVRLGDAYANVCSTPPAAPPRVPVATSSRGRAERSELNLRRQRFSPTPS